MSNAPKVRGAFLTALNRPVLVRPSDAEGTIVLDETTIPADVSLPAVVRLGEETYEVTATPRGEREISGRVALVTGGAQGFGAEIAKGLVDQGCFVFIADLNGDGPPPSARNSARNSPTPSP